MTENLGKWPSGPRKTEKSGHRLAAEGMPFPWRWNGCTNSTDLDVIWGMSVKTVAGPRNQRYLHPGSYGAGVLFCTEVEDRGEIADEVDPELAVDRYEADLVD